ncbi:MAG: hypothetical protein ACRCUJ_05965 [Phocaeicola sp.]
MIKEDYYYTYISLIRHPNKGTLVYGGLHKSTHKDPNDDPYKGSGKYILNFIKKYGKDLVSMRWVGCHGSQDEMLQAEIKLIAQLKKDYGKACVNLNAGGQIYTPPIDKEELANKISKTLIKYKQNLTQEEKNRLGAKLSLSLRSKPHWNHYKALYYLWASEGMPKAGRFRRIAVRASYPYVDYTQMVRHFIKKAGVNYKPTPYDFRTGNKSRRGSHWVHFEALYEIWVKNNKPKYPTFTNIAVSLGFPKAHYITMLNKFIKGVDNEYSLHLEVLEPIRN